MLDAGGAGLVADEGEAVDDAAKAGLSYPAQPLSETVRLEAGESVSLSAFQQTGRTNSVSNFNDGTWLEMTYLGP